VTISEERRLVTALFVDMVGFTSRTETSDPEDIREIQRAYFETVAAEIERYAGTIEKYIGDAVMAIFGAPRGHGDDPERALRAALGIRDALGRGQVELEIRIGVDTGEVVGGGAPGAHAAEYTVTGDAVNVAARLQQAAEPGEIVVGASTRRLAAEAFDFSPMLPLELRGKAAPVEAWRLVRALPERPRVRGIETPLVGRRRELAVLEAALDEAAEGHGILVGLSGEAGIGKSRLALELRSRATATGFASVWTAAQSYASSFPYHVVESLVSELLDRKSATRLGGALRATVGEVPADTLAGWIAVLADMAGEADAPDRSLLADMTPEARKRLVVQALSAVLGARARERPQLLVLDDLHWADAASLDVLDELLALVAELPVAVLALYRPGWTNPWSARSSYQQVNLDRLRETDARQLLGALARRAVDEDRTAELLHRSGGNPFFLEELVRESLGTDRGRQLPETVHELLQARIDALPPEASATLHLAAVIGTEFGTRMLAAIEPVGDLDAALAALVRDDLIVPREGDADDRRFAMRHPLVQEVAYQSLLIARRKVLHRRIGEWLEAQGGEEALAAIASHYRQGDDLDRARRFLPLAAERAVRLNAPSEARDAYLAAADLFTDPSARASMLQPAAHLSYLLGDVSRAVELSSEVVRLYEAAGNRVRELDARRVRGRYYWMDGQGRRAEEEIVAAIDELEQLPPSPELALAYSYHAQVRMLIPDYVTAIAQARRAIEVAEQVGSVEAKVHALNNLGLSLVGIGDEAGVAHLRESLRLALEHHLPDDVGRAYTNLAQQGMAGVSLFPPAEAEALFEEMLDYDEKVVPEGAFHQWHREGRAELWAMQGRWAEAEVELRALLGTIGANRYLLVSASSYLGLVLGFRGRYHEAADITDRFREVAVGINDLQAYGTMLLASAHAARGRGDPDGAIDHLERGLRLRGDTVEHVISTVYLFEGTDILSWLSHGLDVDPATVERGLALLRGLAERLDATAPSIGLPSVLAVRTPLGGAARLHLRLLAGETLDRVELHQAMARHADGLRGVARRFDAARVDLWLGEAAGDAEARDRAEAVFAELGAHPYLERAHPGATSFHTTRRVAGHDL
jgi:adenylate cyclase